MHLAAHEIDVRYPQSRSFSQTQATEGAQPDEHDESLRCVVQGITDLTRGRDYHRGLSPAGAGQCDIGCYIEWYGPVSDGGTDDGADMIEARTNCVRGQWLIGH